MSESIDAFSQATDELFDTIQEQARENTHRLEDKAYLDKLNEEAADKSSYIIIRKGNQIYYAGNAAAAQQIFSRLPAYGLESEETDSAYYFNDMRKLVKQIDFQFADGTEGSAFIVTRSRVYFPRRSCWIVSGDHIYSGAYGDGADPVVHKDVFAPTTGWIWRAENAEETSIICWNPRTTTKLASCTATMRTCVFG